MTIATERFGDVLVAHTPDDLTEETVAGFADALTTSINSGQANVVLQMDRSDVFDSIGLESLLDLQDQAREKGGNVKVCGLDETGRKIFEVTRLDQRFDLFDSIVDAVASFR